MPNRGRPTRPTRSLRLVIGTWLAAGLFIGATPVASAQSTGAAQYEDLQPIAGSEAYARAVAAGPDGFVAIGTRSCRPAGEQSRLRCYGEAWTSADGTDWQAVERTKSGIDLGIACESTGAPVPGLIDVAHGPGGFLAVGYVGSRRRCTTVGLFSSPDGMAWERVTLDAGMPVGFQPSTIIGTPDGYAIGGVVHGLTRDPLALPRAAVLTSGDGTAWTRAKPPVAFDVGGYINTGEAPDSGRISALATAGDATVAVGDSCPLSFSGPFLNGFDSLPPPCFGQSWAGAGTSGWSRVETPTVPDIIDVASIRERVVAAAPICRECPPAMLVADIEAGSGGVPADGWAFAYGSPTGGRLLDLAASSDRFWALLADPGGASLALWSSEDGTRWEVAETPLALPEALEFDERGGVGVVSLSERLVIVGSGATRADEVQRSFAFVVPLGDPV